MNTTQIKRDAPKEATHYCHTQKIYISVDNGYFYYLDGDWIQYDDSCRMQLMEL